MKKLVNVLLYGLLFAVVLAGMTGIAHFIRQEEDRVELAVRQQLEAERQLAAEKEKLEKERQDGSSQPENVRMVLVKELPIYENQKIVKVKTNRGTQVLSFGSKVTVLEEDGLYSKIQTESGTTGYVWSDCIGVLEDETQQDEMVQPQVVVIYVDSQDAQEKNPDLDAWSLHTAVKLEKKLETLGYTAVMLQRPGEDSVSAAKGAELANQIKADAVIHIRIDSSTDSAESGAAVYCGTADGAFSAAECYADSRKLAKKVLKYYTKATGFASAGVLESDAYPGIQRSNRPVVLLRMGYSSNEEESSRMCKPKFQAKMARGIAEGVDGYCAQSRK